MKSLLESLLDDEEIITGTLVEEQIKEWLKENCKIKGDYKIFQEDVTYYVDIKGDIEITNKYIERFPTELFRFNNIKRDFDCINCKSLTSLEGGPKEVGGGFKCEGCSSLTSLKGAPERVSSSYNCTNCKLLKTLEGTPKKIGGAFYCNGCSGLESLKGLPKILYGNFNCTNCESLKTLEGAPKKVEGSFTCMYCNGLTTLEGAPNEVYRYFDCSECKNIKSLKELSPIIRDNLYINGCDKLLNKYPDIEAEVRKYSDIRGLILY